MSELQPKPIPVSVILEKFRKLNEQKKYTFPTEYRTDTPRIGFDQRRYATESMPLTDEEKWQRYLTQ